MSHVNARPPDQQLWACECGSAAALIPGATRPHRVWLRIVLGGSLLLVTLGLLAGPVRAAPPTFLVSGTITAMAPSPVVGGLGTVTLTTAQGPITFLVAAQTVILRNGQPATYNSLRIGDFCKAAITWNGVASQIWDTSVVARLHRAAATHQATPSMPAGYRGL